MAVADVEFAGVSYTLPGGRPLLRDISLTLVAGTTTARRAHCCNAVARATVAHPTVKQMSSFWNLYDMGP